MRDTILIYNDLGQFPESAKVMYDWLKLNLTGKYIILYTDATSILKLNALNNRIKALVIPGGHSRGFRQKLGSEGITIIKDFVKNGGYYYGFCGGGYFGCHIKFTGDDLFIENNDNLNFLKDMQAIGSLPQLTNGKHFNHTVESANACKVTLQDESLSYCYYSGGPYFKYSGNDKTYKVLANYTDLDVPAIVNFKYFEGNVILSGLHPEYTYDVMNKMLQNNKRPDLAKHIENILTNLYNSESSKQADKLNKLILKDLI